MLQEINNLLRSTVPYAILSNGQIREVTSDDANHNDSRQTFTIAEDAAHHIIHVHGLTAAERRHIADVGAMVVPPRKVGLDGKTDPEDPYDYNDHKYIADLRTSTTKQNAIAIIYGCPELREDLKLDEKSTKDTIERCTDEVITRLGEETIDSIARAILSMSIIGVTHDFFLQNLSSPTTPRRQPGENSPQQEQTPSSQNTSTPATPSSTTPA